MKKLKVHEKKRYLCWEDGRPFYYLGDTAWEMFHRLNREEIRYYLDIRASQEFSVIQIAALAEFDGLGEPNAYGRLPFKVKEGVPDLSCPDDEGYSYWKHVDWAVKEMGEKNLIAGILPTWGDKFNKKWGVGPEVFTPENAFQYGVWLGQRYQSVWNIIWILGGDRPLESKRHEEIVDAMARGIKSTGDCHLMTYHPCGETSSVDFVSGKDYIDFHMIQSGHGLGGLESYRLLGRTRDTEKKPFLNGEPRYEDHPACFKVENEYYWNAEDVRQNAYWDMMEGTCGHTYGNHCIWSFNRKKTDYFPYTWEEALFHEGAEQIKYIKKLRLSRDYFSFRTAPELITQELLPPAYQCSGKGDGYAYIYTPYGLSIEANLNSLEWKGVKLSWYNPRTGEEVLENILPTKKCLLVPPSSGKGQDWIAVLTEAW